MNILVVNGPNLNLLGTRKPDIYGTETLEELMMWLENSTESANHNFKFYQSNHEGEIIDTLHDERHWADGVLINAGAYTHYSYAIRDAIESIDIPAIEIHLSDPSKREDFRKTSVLSSVCIDTVSGLGKNSYLEGLKILIK
jgi:3-dehydroquinate dehydratase-2|tara:strand:- start:2827 stop:3249 length:423 start_codon:yes stop_codon:yes gene_type:complete